jgi:hypothetical protein
MDDIAEIGFGDLRKYLCWITHQRHARLGEPKGSFEMSTDLQM